MFFSRKYTFHFWRLRFSSILDEGRFPCNAFGCDWGLAACCSWSVRSIHSVEFGFTGVTAFLRKLTIHKDTRFVLYLDLGAGAMAPKRNAQQDAWGPGEKHPI